MSAPSPEFPVRERRCQIGTILMEAILLGIIGAVLAFAANAISPRRLVLSHNYFPGGTNNSVARPVTVPLSSGPAGTNQPSLQEFLAAWLKREGLQSVEGAQAVQLFRDPRYQQQQIVFVDARENPYYQNGHIPGAYQLDHYRSENLPTVFLASRAAEQTVVYCNGGGCDEAVFTAIILRDALRAAGTTNQNLFVYTGGFTEWTNNRLPVEIGARSSGNLQNVDQ